MTDEQRKKTADGIKETLDANRALMASRRLVSKAPYPFTVDELKIFARRAERLADDMLDPGDGPLRLHTKELKGIVDEGQHVLEFMRQVLKERADDASLRELVANAELDHANLKRILVTLQGH